MARAADFLKHKPGFTAADAFEKRDSYEGAITIALLVLVWSCALFGSPSPAGNMLYPLLLGAWFGVALAAAAYFVMTWTRPNVRWARRFALFAAVTMLALIAVRAGVGLRHGMLWVGLLDAGLAMAIVPMFVPRRPRVAVALILALAAGVAGICGYAVYELGASLPFGMPGNALLGVLGLCIVAFRTARMRAVRSFIHHESEAAALHSLSVDLVSMHKQLDDEVAKVAACLSQLGETASAAKPSRSVRKLEHLSGRMRALFPNVLGAKSSERHSSESLFYARDAQYRALMFSVATIVSIVVGSWSLRGLPGAQVVLVFSYAGGVVVACVALLLATRGNPRQACGETVIILVTLVVLFLANYVRYYYVRMEELTFPDVGLKLLLLGVSLVAPRRLWLGATILVAICLDALVWYFAAERGIYPSYVDATEPWYTLVVFFASLSFLSLGEQRRHAALKAYQLQAQQHAMRRQAEIMLAVCDRLNTPLQRLTLEVAILQQEQETSDALERLSAHVARLCSLSGELARLRERIVPHEYHVDGFDGDRSLERRR